MIKMCIRDSIYSFHRQVDAKLRQPLEYEQYKTLYSIQAYDLQRYGALCWDAPFSRALPDAVPQGAMIPLSPAAETGLVWDMLSDLAGLIRSGTQDQPFASYRDAKITLTGWSQSAVYLYRYLGDVVPYIKRKMCIRDRPRYSLSPALAASACWAESAGTMFGTRVRRKQST